MQYHLNGFRPGDPSLKDAADKRPDQSDTVDVLIVGCGPAGLTLAAQLSAFPKITTRIVERKSGPLAIGQADGIACRSMEMFEAFNFAEKVLKEAYWVNEVAFWRPSNAGGTLYRADRIQDVEDDLSEMPHVILNQARVHDFFLEVMRNGPKRLEPDYDCELKSITRTEDEDYPLHVLLEKREAGGGEDAIRARYVVGCDGARSKVREVLGQKLKGAAARQLWGVMDVLLETDFPDIRLKAAIQSADQGSLLLIPREGGYMVRMYIELDELTGDERASDRQVNPEMLIEKAALILAPFKIDVKDVAWWSAYEIGQRVCDVFDDVEDADRGKRHPRIFIAGDACHTHSPKAGQGMNVSMADSFNLGWKLAAVLQGQSGSSLLDTYTQERRAKAKELIDFDRDMARLFSTKPETVEEAEQFQRYFKRHGRYTAGVETQYDPSFITGSDHHRSLAKGLKTGMRFHSAPVVRLADARPMQLGHAFKADGRWRLVAFAANGDQGQLNSGIADLCAFLEGHPDSPVMKYTPQGVDVDSLFDLRAVFQVSHRQMELGKLPNLLRPQKGKFGLTDYEKAYCANLNVGADIFDMRGIDRAQGALIVVRPDQYVAKVLPLNAHEVLSGFFAGFMLPA